MITRVAHCACGQLSATCRGDPELVSLCNCRQCQRRTGSAFGLAAFFRQQDVTVTGKAASFSRQSDTGATVEFHFCGDCGSTVFWVPRRKPGLIAIAVGCFAEPDFPQPTRYVFGEHRHRWLSLPEASG